MYTIVQVINIAVGIAIIAAIAVFAYHLWREKGPEWAERSKHKANKEQLSRVRPYEADTIDVELKETMEPREAARKAFKAFGLPSVNAGGMILGVPCFSPEQAGSWSKDREVITVARAMGYARQGNVPVDILELTGGYFLVHCASKTLIMTNEHLTSQEETYLKKQRQDAVDRDDGVIESFNGTAWDISSALGTNVTRKAGERECSYLQVLDVHENLGDTGRRSLLPNNLLDGAEHDYYDMKARDRNGDDILYAFYSGGRWLCLIGRVLSDTEVSGMQGV